MNSEVFVFVATAGERDISLVRMEPDGTIRRAEYANINWIERLTKDADVCISLDPDADLHWLNTHMSHMLGRTWEPSKIVNLTWFATGYFTAMRRYHGSNREDLLPETGARDILETSAALGVDPRNYTPEKNSTNRLNWTLRLWERTKD